jgi:RNA polymerase sigma-70 factor (ECF subfamily)
MSVALTDADLVPRIAAGDREAEAELCRRMAPRIRLYGLRHLRSPAAADDLVQQVLMTVLEALRAARLREPEKLAHFVLGTCRRIVLDGRRTSQRHEKLLATFGGDLLPEPPAMPLLDDRRLTRCLQSLKERERSVVVMTFYDEHTAPETARSLGITQANVRVVRHRALQQLRACLEAAS